jgi:hypothetical protein
VNWLKAIPWRLVGALAGAALILWAAWWVTNRIRISYQAELERDAAQAELKTEREQNAANIGAIAQDIADRESDAGKFFGRFDAIEARFDGLQLNMPQPAALVQKAEVPGEPCPRVGVSSDFVGVFNSASTEAGSAEAKAR